MPSHVEAREFWRDFYILSKHPNSDERGAMLLQKLEEE